MDNNVNIYLDTIVFRIQKYGGASTYWKELLVNFSQLKHITLILQSKNLYKLNKDGQHSLNLYNKSYKPLIENILPVSILRYMPLTKKLPPRSIYHASYYRTCVQNDVINIFTIHDFTHKKGYASKFPRRLVHIGLTALGLKNADGIICISESTKRDLMHYYPQISEKKIRVIYHGISDDFFPITEKVKIKFREIFNLNEPFVLFVGKRSGYKKFDIIPKAIEDFKNIKLVIVGGGNLSKSEVKFLNVILQGRYYKLDDVSNFELNVLYNYAFCLIYPSLYEGFGIPLLEAMKAGCPVITNKMSSLSEVGGDAVLTMVDITSDAILEKLKELIDSKIRLALIKKGFINTKKFTWSKCFNETYMFYNEIYNQKFN